MGKITIDEMHNSLFDYAQAVSDESLMTESKTIVGAINEIYGKNLIADSIGEPLNNTDTYTKMSNDINSLLSTFKTNMMNAGVTVESGDKFKQLIDKIATMVEEGEGKGIQFASGEGNWACGAMPNVSSYADFEYELIIPIDIDFDPTYVFCLGDFSFFADFSSSMFSESAKNAVLMNNQAMTSKYLTDNNLTQYNISIQSFTNSQIKIIGKSRSGQYIGSTSRMARPDNIYAWYAIGVGEEDNTLRDSLASVLEDEGVEVTEEDDMATLISKVDEEFDRQVVPVGDATVEDVIAGKTFMNNMGELLTGALVSGLNKIKQDSLKTDTPAGKTLVVSATNIGFKPSIVIIFCGNASSICIAIQDELFSSFYLNGYMFTPTYSIGAGYLNALGTSSDDDYYILNNRFKLTIPVHDVSSATVSWIAIGR